MTDLDDEDEGWMWLPWEELQKYQQEHNKQMNALLDNLKFVAKKPE